MSLVVFLRGINVGGHRSFRPAVLARQLKHFGAVNIGATGTFVIRHAVAKRILRTEITRRLPFEAEVIMCDAHDIFHLLAHNPFALLRPGRSIVQFVSVLPRLPRSEPNLPRSFPSSGAWLLRVLGRQGRFVFGLYRRNMKVISYLGMVDRLYGVRVTTRNWKTITAIAGILRNAE